MTENQKLREAFETYITDDGKWPNAILKAPGGQYLLLRTSVAWQDWKACAEALALPTAVPHFHLGARITGGKLHATVMRTESDGGVTVIATAEMDAASLFDRDCAALMKAKTAAPVGEREIIRAAVAAMPNTNPLVADDLIEGHTMHTEACDIVAIWRAALRAGDAVDAQRYRWLKGRSQVCLNQVWIGGYTTRQRDSDFLSKEDALSAIDAAIDEAMRKGQL